MEEEYTQIDVMIKEAYREWEDAKNYFDYVCENELIDYAAYALEAAKRKFVYMIDCSKRRA